MSWQKWFKYFFGHHPRILNVLVFRTNKGFLSFILGLSGQIRGGLGLLWVTKSLIKPICTLKTIQDTCIHTCKNLAWASTSHWVHALYCAILCSKSFEGCRELDHQEKRWLHYWSSTWLSEHFCIAGMKRDLCSANIFIIPDAHEYTYEWS